MFKNLGANIVIGLVVFITLMSVPFWLEEQAIDEKGRNNSKRLSSEVRSSMDATVSKFSAIASYELRGSYRRVKSKKTFESTTNSRNKVIKISVNIPYKDYYRKNTDVDKVYAYNFCSIHNNVDGFDILLNVDSSNMQADDYKRYKQPRKHHGFYKNRSIDCHDRFKQQYAIVTDKIEHLKAQLPNDLSFYLKRSGAGVLLKMNIEHKLNPEVYNASANDHLKKQIQKGALSFDKSLRKFKMLFQRNWCELSQHIDSIDVAVYISLDLLPQKTRQHLKETKLIDALKAHFTSRKLKCEMPPMKYDH